MDIGTSLYKPMLKASEKEVGTKLQPYRGAARPLRSQMVVNRNAKLSKITAALSEPTTNGGSVDIGTSLHTLMVKASEK